MAFSCLQLEHAFTCVFLVGFAEQPQQQGLSDMARLSTIYYGSLINPESLTSYKALPNCLFSVGPSGNIEWIVDDVAEHALQDALAQKGCIDVDVVALKSDQFIIPGFIDTHTVSRLNRPPALELISLSASMHRSSLISEGEQKYAHPISELVYIANSHQWATI